jgi:DNA-binding MarR family transcriptional regulator/CheY-like chemotaxis protein
VKKFFSSDPRPGDASTPAIVVLLSKQPVHARIARLALAGIESAYLLAESAEQALQVMLDNPTVVLLAISPEQSDQSALMLVGAVRQMRARGRLVRVLIGSSSASAESALQDQYASAAADDSIFFAAPEQFFASIKAAVQLRISQQREPHSPPQSAADPVISEKVRSSVLQVRLQLEQLATQLDQLAFGALVRNTLNPDTPEPTQFPRQRQLDVLRVIRELDSGRRDVLDPFAERQPAWNILAELYECMLTNSTVSITSLCLAADVPVSTALRKIESLIEAGYVERTADIADRRRINAALTESGVQLVLGVLSSYERVLKPFLPEA